MDKHSTALFSTIALWIPKLSLGLGLAVLGLPNTVIAQTNNPKVAEAEIVGSPRVVEEDVTIRVRVRDDVSRPVMGLQEQNFSLTVNNLPQTIKRWISPQESVPPPAWIILLLDMSGSMQAPDPRGGSRLQGAITSIRQFLAAVSERSGDTQVAIVPFGEGVNAFARCAYPVNNTTLDNFFFADDVRISNFLDTLAATVPCASTNIYDPLSRAVRFLSNDLDRRFTLDTAESEQPTPRLSVILLSDGYDNAGDEVARFSALQDMLSNNRRVTVHTIAYGNRYFLEGKPITREDVIAGRFDPEKFLDEERLRRIADATGGIYAYSPDQDAIRSSLILFLNALLGEYEIVFSPGQLDRGVLHQLAVTVVANSTQPITSETKEFRTTGVRRIPLTSRLYIFYTTLVIISILIILPYYFWTHYLRAQEQEL